MLEIIQRAHSYRGFISSSLQIMLIAKVQKKTLQALLAQTWNCAFILNKRCKRSYFYTFILEFPNECSNIPVSPLLITKALCLHIAFSFA